MVVEYVAVAVAVVEGVAALELVSLVDTPQCPVENTPLLEEAEAFLGEALVEEFPGPAMEGALAVAVVEGLAVAAMVGE